MFFYARTTCAETVEGSLELVPLDIALNLARTAFSSDQFRISSAR